MNRRTFVQTLAAAVLTAPAQAADHSKRLPNRKLGRTGLRVPLLGFGSGSRFLMYQEEDSALAALERAIDMGITYIDTAHSYGNGKSEERVGRLMLTRRKEVVLATKLSARTAEEGRRQIALSLKRLQTSSVDVLHIHALKNLDDLATIERKGGILEALYEARAQKLTRAIGITCHGDPQALQVALERHDFDCVQMALNAGMRSMTDDMKLATPASPTFEDLALPVATRKRMGVIAMKVFGQEHLLGIAAPELLIRYALSLPISLASIGMPNLLLIEQNAALARSFKPLTRQEQQELSNTVDPARRTGMRQFFRDHQDA